MTEHGRLSRLFIPSFYNIIVQANLVIKHAEDNAAAFPDEATRSVILGEAYAIRAYCQLDVLRLFGEVPGGQGTKVSLPYSEVTAFDERATRYDFTGYSEKLIADLDKAEKLLKDNDPIFGYTFEELNAPSSVEIEDTYMCYRQSRLNYWAVRLCSPGCIFIWGKPIRNIWQWLTMQRRRSSMPKTGMEIR